jgi:hypothetical protein
LTQLLGLALSALDHIAPLLIPVFVLRDIAVRHYEIRFSASRFTSSRLRKSASAGFELKKLAVKIRRRSA